MFLTLLARHRPAPRQPAVLRHGDGPHRACGGMADPSGLHRAGILEERRRHDDRYAHHGGGAPDPDRPVGGCLSAVGEISTFEKAFYFSAENYTALGYGDIVLSERWRLLGPLEAINGLLLFGLSTAVLFAVMSRLIANRLRADSVPWTGRGGGDSGRGERRILVRKPRSCRIETISIRRVSTRSARCRWTPCRRPTPGTRGRDGPGARGLLPVAAVPALRPAGPDLAQPRSMPGRWAG